MTGSLDESRRLQDAALASLGLFRYKVPEDGNCMFRAVASQLQLDQDHYHTVLRESASAWIQQHVNDLVTAGLLESVSEIQDTATEGKWCGQAALVALANVLKVNIAVVQGGDQGSIDIQHVAPFDGVTSKEHPGILLAYLYNGHYDAVVHEPNVSNPDYAVWSAKCHYNEAISKKVAHKLSDVTRTPPAVRALLRDRGDNNTSNVIKGSIAPKVSTMKIDLQPAKPFVRQDSGIKLTSLRNQHRRPSVDSIRDSAVSSPRGVSFRSTRSETEGMPAKRAQSEARDFRQRRASSPGPTTTRQSPFTSIRAAVEKHRRRSSSREGPVDLPYNYDGSIRLFGASNKPGSLTCSREASPHNKQNRENIYSKENLRRAASAGSKPGEKRSTTPVKNYGIDLKSTGRKITRQSEHEEEYMAPRHLPPKQMSLKDFGKGDAEQSRNDVRRSSEGTNQKKTPGMPAAYATSKPSFGVDYTSKAGQESPKQLVNSTTKQNGFHSKESNDNTSKVPPKVPPKVLPKPPTPQESKKMTVIPIRLSSSKTADKAQQLPSHPVLNGYDGVQRSPRIRTISQQETPGTSSQQQQQQEQQQQQQQQRHQQQHQQRQQRQQQQQHQRQQQHLNRASSSPQSSGASSSTTSREQLSKVSQQEIPSTSSQQQHHLNRASSSPQSSAGSSSTKSREQLSKEATERQYQRMRDVQPNANQQGAPRTRTRSRNGTAGQQSPRVRTRAHKENFEGYHKERVRSRERRQSTDHQQRKIAEAAREAHQVEIDTADIVTTPTEPSDTKKKQLLPFVGTSPSQCRKVNVQVSTEDRDETCQTEAEPIVLRSPRMVRDASTGGSTYAARGVGCITSIPLSPISTSPYIESLSSVAPPHLSPGPYSPGPASTSIPSSPAPGISRVVQLTNSKDSIHEIPLRSSNSLEQQPQQIGGQRRRSVVEIQPQQLQTPSTSTTTSTGRGVINMLLKKTESKGKTNGTTHKSKARMFFS